MDISKLRIIADKRERRGGIPDLLRIAGVHTDIMTLKTGDYIVASETVIERKSLRDFVSSIIDGRLYDQCSRLRSEFKHPILVMEGDTDELTEIIDNPFVFYAAVSRVAIEFGIPLIQTPDATHTAKLLISLGTHNGAHSAMLKRPRKKSGSTLREQQLNMLCSLPGIGERLATRMLAKFGTPHSAISATVLEITKVEGLGAIRAKKLYDIFRVLDKPSKPRRKMKKKSRT